VPADFSSRFLSSLHVSFIEGLDSPARRDSFEWCATEHLRMSGVYWSLMALELMGSLHVMDRQRIIDWVLSCRDEETGGYGGNCGHDAHLLYTLSAVQILVLLEAEDRLDRDAVCAFVARLQQADGSFWGDQWGETDTRFSYCAINLLSLLQQLHRVDVGLAVSYIAKCRNFDGGFGAVPGAESHAGMSQRDSGSSQQSSSSLNV
jgi:geranylgeranyl transferase type-2 subunit beta